MCVDLVRKNSGQRLPCGKGAVAKRLRDCSKIKKRPTSFSGRRSAVPPDFVQGTLSFCTKIQHLCNGRKTVQGYLAYAVRQDRSGTTSPNLAAELPPSPALYGQKSIDYSFPSLRLPHYYNTLFFFCQSLFYRITEQAELLLSKQHRR